MTTDTRTSLRNERLDLRLNSEIKSLFSRAAEYSGTTMSAFIIDAARERAQDLIKQNEIITLSNNDRDVFLELLANPPEPNEKLRRAAEKYRTTSTFV